MSMRRKFSTAVLALLLPVAALGLAACGGDSGSATNPAQWGALPKTEKATYEFVVPYGTGVKIDQGQKIDLMPQLLNVKVGESIRISNKDGRDYMIGPFFVTAGQQLAMRFTQAGELSGVCSMNPEGQFIIKVSA
jgi:hypothetical protein